MGSWLSWVTGWWWPYNRQELRIIVVGLDGAGKTSIMRRLQTGSAVGPHLIQMWDLGGQSSIRSYWRCYLTGTHGIVFVVDSCDHDRFIVSKAELMALLKEPEIANVPVLILSNKCDLDTSRNAVQVSQALDLNKINALNVHSRLWSIQQTSAITGEGIQTGVDWY